MIVPGMAEVMEARGSPWEVCRTGGPRGGLCPTGEPGNLGAPMFVGPVGIFRLFMAVLEGPGGLPMRPLGLVLDLFDLGLFL